MNLYIAASIEINEEAGEIFFACGPKGQACKFSFIHDCGIKMPCLFPISWGEVDAGYGLQTDHIVVQPREARYSTQLGRVWCPEGVSNQEWVEQAPERAEWLAKNWAEVWAILNRPEPTQRWIGTSI